MVFNVSFKHTTVPLIFFFLIYFVSYSHVFVDQEGKMKRVFGVSKSFQLLMNWGFFEIDADTQKRSVVPASPSVIDSAINEFVNELKAFIWGDAEFDGENITGKQNMVQKFTTITTELLELQAI